MSALIVLDQDYSAYTNLDVISGKVLVRVVKPTTVSGITVKLEGEARTRLMPPVTSQDPRPRAQLEFHKILYNSQAIFPTQEDATTPDGRLIEMYSLPPGTHEYPFAFKIPFNSQCAQEKNQTPAVSVVGLSVEIVRPPSQHMRRPLPPTLRGFPGEAEVRYYLKATIARPSLLKGNIRHILPFNFSPIEPPRPPVRTAETYARRRHQFHTDSRPLAPHANSSFKAKVAALGTKPTSSPESSEKQRQPTTDAPAISVEIRVPDPAILTSGKSIPLRILVTSLNPAAPIHNLNLTSLQLDILHHTRVRAHSIVRVESNNVVLLSKTNLTIPLNFNDQGVAEVPAELWYDLVVSRQLPPSFEICNLNRKYEIFARIALQWSGVEGKGKAKAMPQSANIDLRLPTQLYSGIAPPPELLETLSAQQPPPLPLRPASKSSRPHDSGVPGAWPAAAAPPAAAPHHVTAAAAPPPSYSSPPPDAAPPPAHADAPPSYEDAMAERLPAVRVGHERGGYVPPVQQAAGEEDRLLPSDEKRGWH